MSLSIILMILGIFGIIGELFIPSGIAGIIGFGLLACGVLLFFNVSIEFAVVGGILTSVIAAVVAYLFWIRVRAKPIKTGSESFIGLDAIVFSDFSNSKGRVHVNGEEWSARSKSGKDYKKGEKVKITAVIGVYIEVD